MKALTQQFIAIRHCKEPAYGFLKEKTDLEMSTAEKDFDTPKLHDERLSKSTLLSICEKLIKEVRLNA